MEDRFTGQPLGAQVNRGRREGIRAGAVSGPWRATPRPAAATQGVETPAQLVILPRAAQKPAEPDLPAPSPRPTAPEAEVFDWITAAPVAAPAQPVRAEAPVLMAGRPIAGPRHAPIVGAVLLGGGIAVAIVCLAFFLRPAVAGETVTSSAPMESAQE